MIIIFIIIVRIMRGPKENHTQWNSILNFKVSENSLNPNLRLLYIILLEDTYFDTKNLSKMT